MLTPEEVKYNSILETQKSLVQLGEAREKENNRTQLLENRYKYIKEQIETNMNSDILTLKITEIITTRFTNERTTELMKLFHMYNEFFVYNKDLVSNLEKISRQIEDDYNSLRVENNETNQEYDTKQKYWETRVIKLRDKCSAKNTRIIALENAELYNTYNIIFKNGCLLVMCIFNFDITEFIYDYIIVLFFGIMYSVYTNYKIIKKYKVKVE
jgi:transcriptional regulator NrdR family protein